jgi:hypothetical protein
MKAAAGAGDGRKAARSFADVERIRRTHRRWQIAQALLGAFPVFAVVNKIRPILTDDYGRDLLPSLLPHGLGSHYNAELALCLALLAASELLRRRFHARHRDELEL